MSAAAGSRILRAAPLAVLMSFAPPCKEPASIPGSSRRAESGRPAEARVTAACRTDRSAWWRLAGSPGRLLDPDVLVAVSDGKVAGMRYQPRTPLASWVVNRMKNTSPTAGGPDPVTLASNAELAQVVAGQQQRFSAIPLAGPEAAAWTSPPRRMRRLMRCGSRRAGPPETPVISR